MQFIQTVAHLFDFTPSGRKLPRPDVNGTEETDRTVSAAAGQAGIYVRGLLEAKFGDRNLEDIAETVPGADHQRIHTFITDTPWNEDRVLDWVSAQADGMLGGTPQSYLIIDESAFTKKGASSAGVARQYNGRLGKVDNCQVGVFDTQRLSAQPWWRGACIYLRSGARIQRVAIRPEFQKRSVSLKLRRRLH